MIVRRLPMLAVAVASVATVAVVGRDTVEPGSAVFSAVSATSPWMPSAPIATTLSSTWFCPGVPASDADDEGGEIVVANADAVELRARVTLLGESGDPVTEDITVAPHARTTVDVGAAITTPYASAVVEITGGTGVVEQRANHLIGDAAATSVAACATSTSASWYLAEGFTAEGSTEELILTNPSPSSVTVDVGFATQEGSREPIGYQGFPVPGRSVRVIDMAEIAARDEPEVAVSVVATSGTLLVGRSQLYGGTDRRGFDVSLAAPAARDQWWFADGEFGEGITERYSIYNPGDDGVEVTPVLLGRSSTEFVPIDPISVPARQVVTLSMADVPDLPEGRHSMVFDTLNPEDLVVVERVITRTFDDLPTTSVVMGAPPRLEDGYVATTWTMAVGADEATEDALVVYNVDATDAVVTVQAVSPDGVVNVPSLAEVPLPANGLITIDLTDEEAIGRQLIVRSTSRVFVERLLPRDTGALGRVGSWPLPAAG